MKQFLWRWQLSLLLLMFLSYTSQAQNNKIFYIDEDVREIRAMDLGGGNDQVFFKQTTDISPEMLACNNTTQEVFFVGTASGYKIYKMNMDGTGEQAIITSATTIYEIDIDEANGKIYWGEYQSLKRANLDGSNVETLKSTTTMDFYEPTIAGGFLYWSEKTTVGSIATSHIYRGALDATSPIVVHTESYNIANTPMHLGYLRAMTVDNTNGHVYWGCSLANGIFKKNADGTGVVTTIYTNSPSFLPRGLAVDAPSNKIYWGNTQGVVDGIQMANLNGTGLTTVVSGLGDPQGLDIAMVTPTNTGVPEIDVQSNGVSIANNDLTPSTIDNSNFGQVALNNNYKEAYFFIRNTGDSPLNLTGSPIVNITGIHAADFTIQRLATTPVTGLSNTHFLLRFDPSGVGVRTATITIQNSDGNEGSYTFNIQGEGTMSNGETGTNDMRITTHSTTLSMDNEDPTTAYSPTNNRFLVVFEHESIAEGDEEIYGQFVDGNTGALIGGEFRISQTGVDGNRDIDAADPKVVFNPVTNQYMVVWRADRNPAGGLNAADNEVFGHLISPTGTLVNGLGNEIRISQNGPDGNGEYYVSTANIEVNTTNGEYLVVWQANVTASTSDYSIYGQRLTSGGALIGGLGNEFRISQVANGSQYASVPSIAYNTTDNEYLVAYTADFPANGDHNIWAQRVSATGTTINSPIKLTAVGASRDVGFSSTAYNPINNEYFVTFSGDIGPTDTEDEIYGQRVSSTGSLVGSNMQISFTGVDGDGYEAGFYSQASYNPIAQQILVTYDAEELGSTAFDIYASTLDASNYTHLETQSRVSDMGPNGNSSYKASKPHQGFNTTNNKFLIVWEGDDEAPNGLDNEDEIYAQFWQSPATPEIDIQGNFITIVDGDNTPSTADNTDFGSSAIGSPVEHTFKVLNENTEQLVLNGSPVISITGAHSGDFTITTAPSTAIAAGDSTVFEITFMPSASGLRTASISIDNNDAGEHPYNFDIQGTGTAANPEMDVTGNSNSITDNDASPSLTDDTDFGNADITSGTVSHTFTINNSGNAALTLSGSPIVMISGANAGDFTVTQQASSPVVAAGTTTFIVEFNPSVAGVRNATISITNNDADENPYNFAIRGTGTAGPEMDITGNGQSITDGDASPSPTDDTDFGNADITTGTVSHTFTINNSGNGALTLSGSPIVMISGANAADFTITQQASSPVAAAGNTTFIVEFDPNVAGVRNATISISNDDADENPYNFAIRGTGTAGPEMDITGNSNSINDGDLTPSLTDDTDFGNADITTGTVSHTFTINNSGNGALTLSGSPIVMISGANAGDFTVTQQASSPVAAAGNTTFIVEFNPSVAGVRNATITIANDDADENPYNFAIRGTGTAGPEMDVTGNGQSITDGDASPSLTDDTDFGNADITTGTVSHTFTINNSGNGALTLSGSPIVMISGANAGDFTITQQASSPVAAAGSTTFIVEFNPSAAGIRNASISITNDDADENPYNFAIQGTGTAGPEMDITGNGNSITDGDASPSLTDDTDFGNADITTGTVSHTFTINNSGNGALTLSGSPIVMISGANAGDFTVTQQASSPVVAAGTTTFIVEFNPSVAGIRNATITIANDDADENPYNFAIQGTGTAGPEMDITGNGNSITDGDASPSLTDDTDFGNADITTGTVSHTFTINNSGNGALTLSGSPIVMISGANAGDFTVTQQASSPIAAAGSTIFIVEFDPSAAGVRNATITIANDDADENPYNFSIQGTGISAPEIDVVGNGQSISDGDLTPSTTDDTDFGDADVSAGMITKTFTINNNGSGILSLNGSPIVMVTGTHAADFVVSQQATSPVNANGGSTTFIVEFNPGAAGLRVASISIANNDMDENPYNFAVQGTGTAIYVDHTATAGANTGADWANAYLDLQVAIDAVGPGTTLAVAAGTYKPNKNKAGAGSTGRDATYYINKNIIIQGGYPNGGGIQNPTLNKTILSGDLGAQGNSSDNSYHVVWLEGLSNVATLDGIIIQEGNADGAAYPDDRGAGIFNNGEGSNSSPSLKNCLVRWNTATEMGGGLLNFANNNGTTSPILTGCMFYENTSLEGASIANSTYLGGSNSMVITNSTFADNTGNSSIYNRHGNATILVQNSVVWETTGNPISNQGIETTVRHTLISRAIALGPKMIDGGNNIYNINPEFIDAGNDNYALKSISIAIEKGSNALLPNGYSNDLKGGNRLTGALVDLGAVELAILPNPIYVNHAAAGTNDGSSWTNAFSDMQTALASALPGNEVWVATGTYKPTTGTDRTKTFSFRDGIKVYGGFAGAETMESQRNWAVNSTILSGDIGTTSDASDNSYHVVSLKNVTNNTWLDGFVIEGGNSDASYPNDRGAGIYNDGGNSGNSNPTIQNCIIRWNNAATMGGGILNFANTGGSTSPTITGCLFYENTSAQGASVANSTYQSGSNSSVISNSTFADNTGASSIYNPHGNATITIQNSIVWDDNAIHNYANETTVQYSSVKGASLAAGTTDGGNNQLAMNPLFVDAANDDYRLQAASPAIAAANNAYVSAAYTLDLAHNTREIGATVEMGCYEDGANLSRPSLVQNEKSTSSNTASEEQTLARLEEQKEASLLEVATAATMTVYPNPVQDMVHINLKDVNQAATVRLLSTTGQVLIQEQVQADAQTVLQLNMGRLAKGMYLLNVQLEDGTQLNERVVKF